MAIIGPGELEWENPAFIEGRGKSLLRAALLALFRAALLFPFLALRHFGPCVPARAWLILLYAPLATRMQTRLSRISRASTAVLWTRSHSRFCLSDWFLFPTTR
jgi:hypothetical protein